MQLKVPLRYIHPGYVLILITIAAAVLMPEIALDAFKTVAHWSARTFGALVIYMSSVCVILAVWLACGKTGRLRLGRDDERPAYSYGTWVSMLFAAGMGSGLIFYGAAEPWMHILQPPPHQPDGVDSVAYAMAVTYFHWGLHAWAIYMMAALCIAYFSFRHGRPLLPSAAITMHPFWARVIDMIAIASVVFGVVATLSQGVLQLSSGLQYANIDIDMDDFLIKACIIAALSCAFIGSAAAGIGKGIRIISIINMAGAGILLLFVMYNSADIFSLWQHLLLSIGSYGRHIISLSFSFPDVEHSLWMQGWSVTYLLWWIAWAPFIGVFVARISQGRTIREFVVAVTLVPVILSFIWFAAFGGVTLFIADMFQNDTDALYANPQQVIFSMLEQLPYAHYTLIAVLILLFTFLITSADSGTYVLAIFARHGIARPPRNDRLLWGIIIALLTSISVLYGSNTAFFKLIAILGGVPFMFVMIVQIYMLLRALIRRNT